ncbi:unnamed protein product [Triticum turgidum subsp. durum]|uniref:BHLH domain-containing protein n=1 Tax=Triticum turgidum subsp. durum TaxID=4567 RepID=A0A9R0XB35_TRITD|nr:unnamed protein product [Triticum turgidum subsp. durum]
MTHIAVERNRRKQMNEYLAALRSLMPPSYAQRGHRLTVLHLNMSSAGHMVLYSLSLKVEDDCQLTSVDEIATAAHQIVEKIQEEQELTVAA